MVDKVFHPFSHLFLLVKNYLSQHQRPTPFHIGQHLMFFLSRNYSCLSGLWVVLFRQGVLRYCRVSDDPKIQVHVLTESMFVLLFQCRFLARSVPVSSTFFYLSFLFILWSLSTSYRSFPSLRILPILPSSPNPSLPSRLSRLVPAVLVFEVASDRLRDSLVPHKTY